MPQEFQVLHCYSCDTYQDHQVKKSTKWNCKLCGEKQSIKKVYGRGSGYDCRQHVQKLNLMRGSLHNKEPVEQNAWVPNAECHSGDIEDCAEGEEHVILGNTFHQAESRKWSKYVDEEDGSSQTADYENHVDEMYTTDRNKFDGFLKQLKKSHKRKRLNSSNEGDDENSPPTSTQQETNRNPHKRTWTIANRSQQGTRKHNEQKLPSNKLRQEANKIMNISCDDRTESNDAGVDNYSINVENDEANRSEICHISNEIASNCRHLKDNNFSSTTNIIKSNIPSTIQEGSKWGKFVDENEDNTSEESETEEDNVYRTNIHLSVPLNYSSSQEDLEQREEEGNHQIVTERKQFLPCKGQSLNDFESVNEDPSMVYYMKSIREIKHGTNNASNLARNDFLTKGVNSIEANNHCHKDVFTKAAVRTSSKNMFQLDDLKDEDLDFEF